ncbi:outer membrane beta-barrel protein [Mesorhizobium sp.]|uniref:outer membrane protein n=1 Tax=Mesorhizobium sp. TaxID=1871066 RepID=UPI0025C06B71|nr:outer membrane beta-barrel protein [Mesorhizobium sp.]
MRGAGFGDSTTNFGWTVGTGLEVGLSETLSLKAEYLFADLGKEDFGVANSVAVIPLNAAFDAKIHIVRIGLNYRF